MQVADKFVGHVVDLQMDGALEMRPTYCVNRAEAFPKLSQLASPWVRTVHADYRGWRAGVAVVLEQQREGGAWTELGRGTTNADGRPADLLPDDAVLTAGIYRPLRLAKGPAKPYSK